MVCLLGVAAVAAVVGESRSTTTESLILSTDLFLGDMANGNDHSDLLDETWEKITADTQSKGYMNSLKTLLKASSKAYLMAMGTHNTDVYADGAKHEKITHGVGGHAKAHFEWKSNPYSGMFQEADSCVIRVANAAEPSKSKFNPTAYGPNMAIKCFRSNGMESANIQTIWEIDGYNVIPEGKSDSCSMFEVSLSNHCSKRTNISMTLRDTFEKDFDMIDANSMWLGASQLAVGTQNGDIVSPTQVNFPYALVFSPAAGLNDVPCEFSDYTSQLRNLEGEGWVGKSIYKVFAVHDPWTSRPEGKPDLKEIGSLVLDTPFTTSMYGDTQLFFRHAWFAEDLSNIGGADPSRKAVWEAYAANKSNSEVEGAAWYQQFLPVQQM